ncbi:MAG: hypothetical protein IPP85_15040 [Propionivibrio sp.]|nr:hypothetical protein [Propionivibrio sp.]
MELKVNATLTDSGVDQSEAGGRGSATSSWWPGGNHAGDRYRGADRRGDAAFRPEQLTDVIAGNGGSG